MEQRTDRVLPLIFVAVFTIVVEGLSLAEFLSAPMALLIGAGWAFLIGIVALWVKRMPTLSAWVEDGLVALGCTMMAVLAFAGATGILMMNIALDSSSITGETIVMMFLPSIPIAIGANLATELLLIPGLLILGWRKGLRRILILIATGLYFLLRIWTYLVFAADRLDFAEAERSTTPLTGAERDQFTEGLHLNDPRWALNLLLFVLFLLAAFPSRVREVKR